MTDDLLREQIRTQIEVTKDFTKELVDVNKFLKDLKEANKALDQFHNGLIDRLEEKIEGLLEIQTSDISKKTCDTVSKKIDDMSNKLYWRLAATIGSLAAIFSFIVYIINLSMGK